MRVTFYGVRGSIPSPGPATMRYGGNTVCVAVRTVDDTLIILDAGTGIRELGKQLVRTGLPPVIHVLITHSHWDHILGLPFFDPFYRPGARLAFHSFNRNHYDAYGRRFLFDGEHFPVRAEDIPAQLERYLIRNGKRIGSARLSRIRLNHPGGSDGFRLDDDDGSSLCYLTDNEIFPPGDSTTSPSELARFAHGAGLLIHDAQYLPSDMPRKRGWGHSVVDEVLHLGRQAETRMLALHHHDPDRDDQALDGVAEHAAAWARVHAPAMGSLVATEGLSLEVKPP